jgi:hypothetical protein
MPLVPKRQSNFHISVLRHEFPQTELRRYTGHTQKNGTVSKVDEKDAQHKNNVFFKL